MKTNIVQPVEKAETVSAESTVIIGKNLKETLEINSSRVNKTTKEFYTPTKIIFEYVGYINRTQLLGVADKKEYLRVAKNLLAELSNCGFEVGADWRDNRKLPFSKGNSKLSSDTVIINVGCSSLCSSANLLLCENCRVCYALNSESRYLNTLIYRLEQLVRFESLSAEQIADQFKNLRVFKFLRVNEGGDIFNKADIYKIKAVAEILHRTKGVYTYLYTHRTDLNLKDYQTEYLKINDSTVDYVAQLSVESNHKTLFCDSNCENCIYCKIDCRVPITALYHGELIGVDNRDSYTVLRDNNIKTVSFNMFETGATVGEIREFIKNSLKI